MIQNILLFLLGFLCAGLLALMIAPSLWRRAVNLTRKRIESSIPLTMSEIQAEKDSMRAEFAMATRRLEIKLKSLNEKSAAQAADIAKKAEEIRKLTGDRDDQKLAIAGLETHIADLEEKLDASRAAAAQLEERLAAAREKITAQADEIDRLGRMYDEASFAASSRQIDLVARETEVEKLSNDLARARNQRKDAERKQREASAASRQSRTEMEAERKKVADLERRLARMMTTLSDREEKLERREKELAGLRGKPRETAAPATGDAALREEIHQLAAEMVAMTAKLESDDSPLRELVEAGSDDPKVKGDGDRPVSLAERVRALHKAAEAG